MKRLILGGVKSGKSRYAEQCVKNWQAANQAADSAVIYIATAQAPAAFADENAKNAKNAKDTMSLPIDQAFADRIAQHRKSRPAAWQTIEEPLAISPIIQQASGQNQCLLLECLTLWLSNLLAEEARSAASIEAAIDALCSALEAYEGEIIIVSNETGLGIMPMNALARRFGDEAGLLHQRLAGLCDEVVLTVAGLPQRLKSPLLLN